MKICPLLPNNLKIKVATKDRWCKYYKTKGLVYSLSQIAPPGLCLEAFHITYPYCLGLLYGANFGSGNSMMVKCPNPQGGIVMQIEALSIKSSIQRIYNKIKRIINLFGYPADYIDKRIVIKVIEKGENCPYSYEKSATFEFNTGNGCGICPASFDAIYPSLHGALKGLKLHCSVKDRNILGQCPDHRVNVVYDLINGEQE